MPGRETDLITDETYHIFNKSIDHKKIFHNTTDKIEFLNVIRYYSYKDTYLRFSLYKKLPSARKEMYDDMVFQTDNRLINILAYCIMPTHYHLLLRQRTDYGISRYLSQVQNSFTRYHNTRHKRSGHIFIHSFKAVHISSEDQFKHVSRYIHLNPYSGKLVKTKNEVLSYEWSSCREYVNSEQTFLISNPSLILSCFQNNSEKYKKFLLDHADYQRMIEYCKHAYKWEKRI